MAHIRLSVLRAAEEGVGAIEFALIAPLLLAMLLGVLDFGIGFWEQMEVANAAQAGAAYATKYGYDSASIQTAVTNATTLAGIQATPVPSQTCGCPNSSSGVSPQTCNTTCPSGDLAATYVTINAQISYNTLFKWPGLPDPVTLASSTIVRIN